MTTNARQMTVGIQAVVRFLVMLLSLLVVLFVSAGTWDWPMAWAYTLLTLLSIVGSRLLLFRRHPDLIAERANALSAQDAKRWDKPIVQFVGLLGPMLMMIVAGLDVRFGWRPEIPLWLQIIAFVLVALGALFSTWAMLTNRFFSGVVRIQADRGHTVVSDGPYRYIRHPGYAGGVIANLAGPLALGSVWALIPGGLTALVTIVRTMLEDRTLIAELPGYAGYAQRTRYRLLPGVW